MFPCSRLHSVWNWGRLGSVVGLPEWDVTVTIWRLIIAVGKMALFLGRLLILFFFLLINIRPYITLTTDNLQTLKVPCWIPAKPGFSFEYLFCVRVSLRFLVFFRYTSDFVIISAKFHTVRYLLNWDNDCSGNSRVHRGIKIEITTTTLLHTWWHLLVGWASGLQFIFFWDNADNQKYASIILPKMNFWISQGDVAISDRWGRQVCKIFMWSNFLKI